MSRQIKQDHPGRPKAEINEEVVRTLAGIGCTVEEIAYQCGVNKKTIERRFQDVMEQGRNRRNISLRRKQFDMAIKGDKTMLIWLGKQMLGQSDKTQLTGKDDGPIQHEHDVSKLSDEELNAEIDKLLPAVATTTGKVGDPSSGAPAAA